MNSWRLFYAMAQAFDKLSAQLRRDEPIGVKHVAVDSELISSEVMLGQHMTDLVEGHRHGLVRLTRKRHR